MKIATETPTLLVLKQGTISSYIFGVLFLLIGIGICVGTLPQKTALLLIIGGVFALLGIAAILFAKAYTVTIDKSTNIMNILSTGILGKKSQAIQIAQIKEISLEEYVTANYSNNSAPQAQMNFNLVFYLQDGTGIPFKIDSSSGFTFNGLPLGIFMTRNKNVQLGNKIAAFLGVPFIDRRPPTLQQSVTKIIQTIQNDKSLNEAQRVPQQPQ